MVVEQFFGCFYHFLEAEECCKKAEKKSKDLFGGNHSRDEYDVMVAGNHRLNLITLI
jgi:hypothetical protein